MAIARHSWRFPVRLPSRWARFGLALGLIVAASLARTALGGIDWRLPPFLLYTPAILVATLFGGWSAGAAATGFSLLLAWALFAGPWVRMGTPYPLIWAGMALYAATAVAIVGVAGSHTLSIDHEVALGIVVNELVTNAVKYAYPPPRRGSIHVSFQPTERGATLTVSDSGCGLPADFASAEGGLGAKLVKSFVAQVGGDLTIRHTPGATFEISLPAPAQQYDGSAGSEARV